MYVQGYRKGKAVLLVARVASVRAQQVTMQARALIERQPASQPATDAWRGEYKTSLMRIQPDRLHFIS